MVAHILLVEDEVKLARFIELELASESYRVTVANDGMSGLSLARETEFDLAILDWMMPGLTGVELCRRLRSTLIRYSRHPTGRAVVRHRYFLPKLPNQVRKHYRSFFAILAERLSRLV